MACLLLLLFFFNYPATPEIYTLSLHDALPICRSTTRSGPVGRGPSASPRCRARRGTRRQGSAGRDRKSTRLNSSHEWISYAVFCLKKKKQSCTQIRDPLPPRDHFIP